MSVRVIETIEFQCRDCYRCLRICPLKAIKVQEQAETGNLYTQVIDELCVQDGLCVLECPRKAKKITSNIEKVKQLVKTETHLIASVAPSFVSALPLPDPRMLPTLLRKIGFTEVHETSVGANLVARKHRELGLSKPLIGSSCPAVVNLVERYYPELLPMLAPVVSPMLAHGRLVKGANPDCRIVFIGPCAAKIDEARLAGIEGVVDYVIGFNELWQWVLDVGIAIAELTPSQFDGFNPGRARLFPLEGGMVTTVQGIMPDVKLDSVSISGLENCIKFLDHLSTGEIQDPPQIMELLACHGGCLNGPLALGREESLFVRKRKVTRYYDQLSKAVEMTETAAGSSLPPVDVSRNYQDRKIQLPYPDESIIKNILEQIGKSSPEDELNCGACGYPSCRDKAVAVYQGKAELEMCMPFMRRQAESMANLVMSNMPSATILVDRELNIIDINSAAEELFKCRSAEVVGKELANIIPTKNFSRVMKAREKLVTTASYPRYGIFTREIIFPVKGTQMVVGVLSDITAEMQQQNELEFVKSQAIIQAQEVIEKQMMVAQEIAGLLGETTAETKIQLSRLIKLMRKDPL